MSLTTLALSATGLESEALGVLFGFTFHEVAKRIKLVVSLLGAQYYFIR
jgi:hypothetical protein